MKWRDKVAHNRRIKKNSAEFEFLASAFILQFCNINVRLQVTAITRNHHVCYSDIIIYTLCVVTLVSNQLTLILRPYQGLQVTNHLD